jgi:deoxyribodipyrimidine photo-lyase
MPEKNKPTLIWLRRDLRLRDHLPLTKAVEKGNPVMPVYIHDRTSPEIEKPGAASLWWLHHSLSALQKAYQDKGIKLILRRGPAVEVLGELCKATAAGALYFHRSILPGEEALEQNIAEYCKSHDIDCRRFRGETLFEPGEIRTGSDTAYKVFTPFWKACLEEPEPGEPLPIPHTIPSPEKYPESDALAEWDLMPTSPNWAKGFHDHWQPGEEGARQSLTRFLKSHVSDYKKMRDYPAEDGTSRLSPHLHYGEISIRDCWHQTKAAHKVDKGAEAYLRELGWREFCYHLLHHWPEMEEEPFRPEFAAYPWKNNADQLKAWQKGETGYPIIDAAMRQLWQTGWMHNRLRMLVGSFLVKNLMIHWHEGRDWFWDTLVDADIANNSAGWQWIAGSGADAAPYFRIFNPVTQSEKFDKEGEFIRSYVPELQDLPTQHIHAPYDAPEEVLEKAGIKLGKTYPNPIADLKSTRQAALKVYEQVKASKDDS